jgi:hypothetical protein
MKFCETSQNDIKCKLHRLLILSGVSFNIKGVVYNLKFKIHKNLGCEFLIKG